MSFWKSKAKSEMLSPRPRQAWRSGTGLLAIGLAVALTVIGILRMAGSEAKPVASATGQSEKIQTIELLPEDVAEARQQELEPSIPLTGTVFPLNQTELKSQQASEIESVLVRAGESVSRGQVLARLNTTELDAKLRDKLGALAVGKAQLALAEKNLRTNASLRNSNFISQNAFDNIRNSFQINEAGLLSLQAQVEQARKALADAVIRSPMDGVVAERMAQPGLAVNVNAKLFTIQDLAVMNVEAAVPARDIPLVEIGRKARLQIEGFNGREFIGTVERINPSTEQGTRSIIVHLSVANPDGALKGGMFAQGSLAIADRTEAVVVPIAAISERDGKSSVLRIEAGRIVEQVVETGERDTASGMVAITAGLPVRTMVIVGKAGSLRPGQSVSVATRPQPAGNAVSYQP